MLELHVPPAADAPATDAVCAQAMALAGLLEGMAANEQRPREQRHVIRHGVDGLPVCYTLSNF